MRTQGKDTKLETHQIIFGTIETVGLLIGGVINLLLLTFHLKQPKKTTTILIYCLMNGTDFIICILMIPTVISCWAGSKPLFFESLVAREIWLFLWEVSGRTSVFLIGLQSVLRTRALLSPFAGRMKKKILAVIFMVYLTVLCGIHCVHFIFKVESIFSSNCNRPILLMGLLQLKMGLGSKKTIAFLILNSFFGYVVPFLPITISCLISVCCLGKSKRRAKKCHQNGGKRNQNHQAASNTVVLLTIVYILTNALTFFVELNDVLISFSKIVKRKLPYVNWNDIPSSDFFIIYVTAYNVCILLNSVFNGLVFFIRTGAIRAYSEKIIRKTSKAVRSKAMAVNNKFSRKSMNTDRDPYREGNVIGMTQAQQQYRLPRRVE